MWADGFDDEDGMLVHPGRLQGVGLLACLLTTEGSVDDAEGRGVVGRLLRLRWLVVQGTGCGGGVQRVAPPKMHLSRVF
jgi:hypothetical protein